MAELSAYQKYIKAYFKSNPGANLQDAVAGWNSKGGGNGRRKDACASNVVPTPDGSAVTTRGGAHLRASVEGHTEVMFDQGALGAIWSGVIERWRSDGGANLAALFPDLYPQAAMLMRMDRQYADNRVIGTQMAALLGATLVAYRVTPEEWASWYVIATQQRFVVPQQLGTCVTVSAAMGGASFGQLPANLPAEAVNQAQQFGGVLGAPGGAVLPGVANGGQFGSLR